MATPTDESEHSQNANVIDDPLSDRLGLPPLFFSNGLIDRSSPNVRPFPTFPSSSSSASSASLCPPSLVALSISSTGPP